jgi:chromosome segregation ATPase
MANDFAEVLRAVKDVGESVDENGTRFDKRFDEVNGKIDTLTNSDATNTRRLDSAIGRLDTIEKDRTERIKDNNDRWKDMNKEVEELKTQVTSWKGGTAVLFAAMTLIATGIAIWKGIH